MAIPRRARRLAGEHRGRGAIFAFLASVMTLTGGTFDLDIEDITAGENNVVVLFTGHGQRDGKTLDNSTALRVRIREGQAAEFRELSGTSRCRRLLGLTSTLVWGGVALVQDIGYGKHGLLGCAAGTCRQASLVVARRVRVLSCLLPRAIISPQIA